VWGACVCGGGGGGGGWGGVGGGGGGGGGGLSWSAMETRTPHPCVPFRSHPKAYCTRTKPPCMEVVPSAVCSPPE